MKVGHAADDYEVLERNTVKNFVHGHIDHLATSRII